MPIFIHKSFIKGLLGQIKYHKRWGEGEIFLLKLGWSGESFMGSSIQIGPWKSGLDFPDRCGKQRLSRLMEPLGQSSGDEKNAGMSEQWEEFHVTRMENARGLMINGRRDRSEVKTGYIKTLFCLPRVALKHFLVGPDEIMSSRYKIWSRDLHDYYISPCLG